MQTHSQLARRKARAWQLGAVALLACAGAALAIPKGLLAPSTAPARATGPAAAPQPVAAATDINKGLGVLETVAVKPTPPAPTPTQPEVPPEPVVISTPVSTDWVYIGSVITPTTRHAMVRVGAEQHLFGVNAGVNDTKVVAIEPGHIEIQTGAEPPRRLDLPSRVMTTPAEGPKIPVMFKPPPTIASGPRPGMNPGMAMPMGAPGAGGTFDGFRAGMTPEQARAAAEARATAESQRAAAAGDAPVYEPPERSEKEGDPTSTIAKALLTAEITTSEQKELFAKAGIQPGMTAEEIEGVAVKYGIDPNDETFRANVEAMTGGVQGEPELTGKQAERRAQSDKARRGKKEK